jgi:UDP-glucose 4-epimerase
VRDYIHVADLADAHLRALDATADQAAANENTLVCNLGNGDGFSNLEVIHAAERVMGRPIDYEVGPKRPGDPPVLVASAERAAERLGWRPARPSLEEMIGSAWAWRRAHPGGYPD